MKDEKTIIIERKQAIKMLNNIHSNTQNNCWVINLRLSNTNSGYSIVGCSSTVPWPTALKYLPIKLNTQQWNVNKPQNSILDNIGQKPKYATTEWTMGI